MKTKLNPNFEKFIDEENPQIIIAIKDTEEDTKVTCTSRVSRKEGEKIIAEACFNFLKDHVMKGLPF